MVVLVHDRVQIAANLINDLKKVTPPTFNGKTLGEEVKAWIATMEKYFHVHNFTKIIQSSMGYFLASW